MRSMCLCGRLSMSTETLNQPEVSAVRTEGSTWYALIGLCVAVIYAPTLRWLFDSWMNDRFYSHGILVALVCAWLISRQWDAAKETPVSSSRLGMPLIVLALVLCLAGTVSDVMTLTGISLVLAACGLVLACRGARVFKLVCFPTLYFLFAVPVISAASDASGRVLTPMMEFATTVTAG